MKLTLRSLAFSAVFAVGLTGLPVSAFLPGNAIARAATACTTTGYTHNCGGCIKFTSTDAFSIRVPKTKLTVTGRGTSRAVGTTVCVIRIAPPRKSKGGIGLRVTATGPFAAIHVPHAHLYRYNVGTGKLKHVKTISHAGLYQIV
jgi:hypothetical protein